MKPRNLRRRIAHSLSVKSNSGRNLWQRSLEGTAMIRKKEPSGDNFGEPFESYGMSGTSTTSPYNKYLRIEDIKYVTGLRDVRQVEFHPAQFLGCDLNFVNELGGKI